MDMTLLIADRTYSSWSLRGHLLVEIAGPAIRAAGGRVRARCEILRSDPFREMLAEAAPARSVPALVLPDGAVAWDSLAIAEELASRFPDAGIWPEDPAARAFARSMAAEMHSGFLPLRRLCPMNMARAYAGWSAPEPEAAALAADVARVALLWRMARERFGAGGPWLFGAAPCAADAMFAPVASRLATYDLTDDPEALGYVETIHAWPAVRRWRAMGAAEGRVNPDYEVDLPARGPLPGPAPRPARPVTGMTPVNDACPYSGRPVQDGALAEIDGVVVGFCNPFCRDKSVADADAWPDLAPLLPQG